MLAACTAEGLDRVSWKIRLTEIQYQHMKLSEIYVLCGVIGISSLVASTPCLAEIGLGGGGVGRGCNVASRLVTDPKVEEAFQALRSALEGGGSRMSAADVEKPSSEMTAQNFLAYARRVKERLREGGQSHSFLDKPIRDLEAALAIGGKAEPVWGSSEKDALVTQHVILVKASLRRLGGEYPSTERNGITHDDIKTLLGIAELLARRTNDTELTRQVSELQSLASSP